jgi:hypothetical protein
VRLFHLLLVLLLLLRQQLMVLLLLLVQLLLRRRRLLLVVQLLLVLLLLVLLLLLQLLLLWLLLLVQQRLGIQGGSQPAQDFRRHSRRPAARLGVIALPEHHPEAVRQTALLHSVQSRTLQQGLRQRQQLGGGCNLAWEWREASLCCQALLWAGLNHRAVVNRIWQCRQEPALAVAKAAHEFGRVECRQVTHGADAQRCRNTSAKLAPALMSGRGSKV